MKKILTVIGARPQFIKSSIVSQKISRSESLTEVVVHTGQHYDHNMSEVFFSDLEMDLPKYQLNINNSSHGEMTGRMLAEIEKVLIKEKPHALMVYGDTNSTLAGALAASKMHIPVAHVEAGLRSFNMRMPEEVNRILTDRVSRWLFVPTTAASEHLKTEGFGDEKIKMVGDVMHDVALYFGFRSDTLSKVLEKNRLSPGGYILATIHRAENTDDISRLGIIVESFRHVSMSVPVVWPLHPRTKAKLRDLGVLGELPKSVKIIDPVGYIDMVQLEKNAKIIATDSGGVQKEAYFYRVPCVTLRNETEWVELVEAGWNRLSPPTGLDSVVADFKLAMTSSGDDVSLYGNGDTALKIVSELERSI